MGQENHIKTALRLPPELHAQLHAAAAESGRSYNGEILQRLARSFEGGTNAEEFRQAVELAVARERALQALGTLDTALATILQRLIDRLPAKDRDGPEVGVWRALADAVVHQDGLRLAEALAAGPAAQLQRGAKGPRAKPK